MDIIFDSLVVLVEPFFYLLFMAVFIIFIVRPFFKYLAVNKIIREQRILHKEYQTHKEKIKKDRRVARQASEEKIQQLMSNTATKPDAL